MFLRWHSADILTKTTVFSWHLISYSYYSENKRLHIWQNIISNLVLLCERWWPTKAKVLCVFLSINYAEICLYHQYRDLHVQRSSVVHLLVENKLVPQKILPFFTYQKFLQEYLYLKVEKSTKQLLFKYVHYMYKYFGCSRYRLCPSVKFLAFKDCSVTNYHISYSIFLLWKNILSFSE